MSFEPMALLGQGEGPASDDYLVRAQRQGSARRIDEPNEKVHPGRRRKARDLAGADGEEGAPSEPTDDSGRGRHAVDLDPAVERVAAPRPAQ